MAEPYVVTAVFLVFVGGLTWLGFHVLFGNGSPWKSATQPAPPARDMRRFNKVVTALDVAGLTIASALLAWHFAVRALPDPLLRYVVLPLMLACAIGCAKAAIRRFRRDAKT